MSFSVAAKSSVGASVLGLQITEPGREATAGAASAVQGAAAGVASAVGNGAAAAASAVSAGVASAADTTASVLGIQKVAEGEQASVLGLAYTGSNTRFLLEIAVLMIVLGVIIVIALNKRNRDNDELHSAK